MITTISKLKKILLKAKHKKKKIVFTNGCFDILHTGHIKILQKAKSLGDIVVVGLNTDRSVKRLKGSSRPINNQRDRAILLDSIKFVDYIIFFNEDTPLKVIQQLKPDILVKGGDYKLKEVVGYGIVPKIVLVKVVKGKSTTNIIKKCNMYS
jgi:D-beta-D-heptose 7-phosphate kinase/D-beta-D-heptose 1-phosphate adenosyltransferase